MCGTRPGSNPINRYLPRKEVIHPHLPVRIPCYDFTPIADPTLGPTHSFKIILNSIKHLKLCVGTSDVTNFRGVTGGVYKTRERIHRSIADLRLLAIPTS